MNENLKTKEIDLIKSIFSDNEALLKSMRALFLGLEISQDEKDLIKSTFVNDQLRKIMWTRFYPQLSRETPIGQVQDVWLGVEQMVFGQSKDTVYQAVHYKKKALEMTKQALELLDNPDGDNVDISYDPTLSLTDELQINLLARNQYIRHVEDQLKFIWMIAQHKEETEKETKERMIKDSAK